jgi:hypothetical protein
MIGHDFNVFAVIDIDVSNNRKWESDKLSLILIHRCRKSAVAKSLWDKDLPFMGAKDEI